MRTWIFQSNPDIFDIDGYLATTRNISFALSENRIPRKLSVGDRVFLWRSAGRAQAESGVIASGRVTSLPSTRDDDPVAAPFWRQESPGTAPRVLIQIDNVARQQGVLRRIDLKQDPVLHKLTILSSATGRTFWVTEAQADRLEDLWARALPNARRGALPRSAEDSIPDGITPDDIRGAVSSINQGVEHDFGPSTKYDVIVDGRPYAPKAVIGLAAARLVGRVLQPSDFKGGSESKCFAVLRAAGFDVVPKPESCPFDVGRSYTRNDVYDILGVLEHLQGGDWDTGYHEHAGVIYVFCNVGVPGRTGHDYENRFEGDDLVWYAKRNTRLAQPQIRKLLDARVEIRVFFRTSDRAPFEFAGRATAIEHADASGGRPVLIRWAFRHPDELPPGHVAEEIVGATKLPEGARQLVEVNRYERNRAARRRCIEVHGIACVVCGFSFERVYGERGVGYIHVHHLVQLASREGPYEVDPEQDLRPVCANCHAMIHLSREPVSIDELKAMLQR